MKARLSGLLGAALLAAALLLAPGEARALIECGPAGANTLTCSGATYNDGIYYPNSAKLGGSNPTVNIPGRSAGSTTITLGSQAAGIHVESQATHGFTVNVGGSTGGTAHVVNIVQGTNSVSGIERNNGVYLRQLSNNRTTTLDVRSGVTIGSSATPIKQNGIYVDLRPTASSLGVGATAGTITNAATIHAARQGIRVRRETGGTNAATTITNTGAIHSGVGNATATGAYFDRPHGIYHLQGGTQMTGSVVVANSGDITLGGAYTGILLNKWGAGVMSLDNSGDIAAVAGQTARQGIQFNYNYWNNRSAAAVTLTNSGDITASEFGIRLKKLSGGDVALTNSGDVTATGDAATNEGHAIYLADNFIVGEGRTYAQSGHGVAAGDVTIVNRGALRSKNHALYVFRPASTANGDDFELTNSGDVVSEDGDGIRLDWGAEGDVTFANGGTSTTSGNVSGRWRGIYVGKAARIDFDQTAGTITSGRTGVTLQVTRESAMGDTRSADSDGNHVPAIDVAWTGGNVARGTATDDQGRFRAATAAQVLAFDRESAAVKAVEGTLHYGGAAGIEAHALSWRDVAAQAAKGDDPGEIANNAAQMNLLSTTHADSRRAAILAQFRAALGNDEIAVAAPILTAIGTTATTAASQLTDTQIVTYLSTDNGATRTLLRNVLAQGLSDDEKAILRAVATNDGVDAALTAAGFSDDASDDSDYWSLVKALLDRHNLDDIRVSMTAGSIASRGDGIRAYYATPHADNGGIDVTIGAGVSVTAAKAGVYVANAGGDVTVSNSGTVTGGTYGIYAVNADAIEVTVAAGASVTGGAAGVYVANAGEGLMLARKYTPGYAPDDTADELVAVTHGEGADAVPLLDQLVRVHGMVTGGTDAAVHLDGGGAVIVEEGGKAHAGSSGVAIKVNDPGPALAHINGEVKGGAGGDAAVHLTGGGSVVVGLNGRVQANGADHAIRGGGDAATMVALTLATDRIITYQEDATEAKNARVEGSIPGVEAVRFREHRDGVFTGYRTPLMVTDDGMLDTSGLDPRPCPSDAPVRGADGVCGTGDGSEDGGSGDPMGPGAGPGTDPGTDPGTGPGTGDPGTDPGTGPGDPGTGPGTDPGTGGPGVPMPTFSCEDVEKDGDRRCRLYEALPSMLLAMNRPPSYADRMAAARDGNGAWARVEASRGKWRAKKATTAEGLAYDHSRGAGQAGVDFIAGESVRGGVSAHAVGGSAEMSGVGEVDLKGWGAGVSATWLDGGLYVDAQAAVTVYDVDVKSHRHGRMSTESVHGAGYALGVDVGARMPVGETMFVTPRAGVAWSRVDLADFTDMERGTDRPDLRARVSVADVDSVKGRVGVTLEAEAGPGRLFGSLDVERELSDETEVSVGGSALKTEVRPTAARLGIGGVFDVGENVRLKATAGYRTSGSSATSAYDGALELQVQF